MNKYFRFTTQKRIVYNDVVSRCDHPTANEIYVSIHQNYPNISKSTVYRNLDVLAKEGLIRRIKTSSSDHFDFELKNHNHVICKHCHKVIDSSINHSISEKEIEKETGFIIESCNFVFEGICPECQSKHSA